MRRPLRITQVNWRQKARLECMYREANCPRFRIRVQMVLLSIAGKTIQEIAEIVRESDETVRRWLNRFIQGGCDGLTEGMRTGRPAKVTTEVECFLLTCIEQSPRDYGLDRSMWTTELMAKAVEAQFGQWVSGECIRQHLAQNEAVCRRPTWSVKHLAIQTPGYAQKKPPLHGFCDIRHGAGMCMSKMKLN